MEYNNQYGKVTGIGKNFIEIDSIKYPVTNKYSCERIALARPFVGNRVEFNFNVLTKEIIFIQNKDRKSSHYTTGPWGYVEDPRDPDEAHDMNAIYGHSFEGK
jgi:hypothetical protein